jgi:hypothetical protein
VDIGAFRKHRVEVRGCHDVWLARHTRALAEDVSDTIKSDVREPACSKAAFTARARRAPLKRRSRNLAETDLIVARPAARRLSAPPRAIPPLISGFAHRQTREKHEPENANRARDHFDGWGTAIQTTGELSKQAKKFHNSGNADVT